MEKSNEAPRRAKVLRTDEDYLAKLRYGYLTVTVAILSFVGLLVMNYLLLDNALYIKILVTYAKAYRGFIRTILIIIATIIPVVICRRNAVIRPVRSIVFYFISLFVWGLPLGMIMIAFPQVIIPAALQVTVLTLIFCSIGMLFKKDLSSWGSILGFGLVSVILATLLNSNFLHLSFVSSLSYYATVVIFLGYLIYDANIAMNLYPEAKKVGGLCLVSVLLASSLDILQDIIILFMESILSDNDLDGDDFDSFW